MANNLDSLMTPEIIDELRKKMLEGYTLPRFLIGIDLSAECKSDQTVYYIRGEGGDKMSEKIAVHCKTREEWDSVQKKAVSGGILWCDKVKYSDTWSTYGDDSCIAFTAQGMKFSPSRFYKEDGYTIISAQEYLKEGGGEEFKVGDRVELVMDSGHLEEGGMGTIEVIEDPSIGVTWDKYSIYNHNLGRRCKEGHGFWVRPKDVKHVNKQKEETEMSITINSTVAKVFKDIKTAEMVTRHVGSEYPEDNHRAYLDLKNNEKAVLKYCQELEDAEKASKDTADHFAPKSAA